jgi:dTDP-4-amino-4,6-dideoxygalactose transaminase
MNIKPIKVAEPQIGTMELEAVAEVLQSGEYISGKRVEAFENHFANYIGVKDAIAVNSGTSALHIALEAMGIARGDEVIVPPITFFATISSVLYLGAIPVFADIDLDDLCLSPESVEAQITEKTKAMIPVHLFGVSAKMEPLLKLSGRHGIPILEDCAQAHGTEYFQKKVGAFGEAGAFSFFATKHITTGEGGIIATNNMDLAEKARIIRNHGMMGRDIHVVLGYNNRMTEIEAAMGLVQLKKLDALNQKRISNSEILLDYAAKLPWASIPQLKEQVKHTYFWCPIMVKEKSGKSIHGLKEHLRKWRIGFRDRYKEPLYRQPVFKRIGLDYSNVMFPNAEKVAGSIIGLPNHPGLTKAEIERIMEALDAF